MTTLYLDPTPVVIVPPASEPVSLAEARLHLRMDADNTVDDGLIQALITSAREMAEHETGRSLMAQTLELAFDEFPEFAIKLARPPVMSMVSITYIDTLGVSTVLSPLLYSLDAINTPGYVMPAQGTSWPWAMDTANAVRVRYIAGYGDATAVPKSIKQWMLLNIGTMYEHRMTLDKGNVIELPTRYAGRMLDPYRYYS